MVAAVAAALVVMVALGRPCGRRLIGPHLRPATQSDARDLMNDCRQMRSLTGRPLCMTTDRSIHSHHVSWQAQWRLPWTKCVSRRAPLISFSLSSLLPPPCPPLFSLPLTGRP